MFSLLIYPKLTAVTLTSLSFPSSAALFSFSLYTSSSRTTSSYSFSASSIYLLFLTVAWWRSFSMRSGRVSSSERRLNMPEEVVEVAVERAWVWWQWVDRESNMRSFWVLEFIFRGFWGIRLQVMRTSKIFKKD